MTDATSLRSGAEIMRDLDDAAREIQAAGVELSRLITTFGEAFIGSDGAIKEGTKLRYEIAVKDEIARLYESALTEERRVPPEDVRSALAERAVRAKDPTLYAEYNASKTRIEALRLFISGRKAVISAYQSLRKGEAA